MTSLSYGHIQRLNLIAKSPARRFDGVQDPWALEVAEGAERLGLGGPRQEIVLATLLLSANHVVSIGRLQEAIYGEDLPPTSRSQAQISISSLRRLFASHGHAEAISTRAHGYVIQV